MAGKGLQYPDLTFPELYGQAKVAAPLLLSIAEETLAALKRKHKKMFATASFEMGDLKTEKRAIEKIEGDYKGDHTQITDIARGRFIVRSPAQVKALSDYFAENATSLGIEKSKNRFEVPSDTHFRDVNMAVRMPNGHVVELRIEHEEMVRAAKQTHKPYEEIQKIERLAEREQRDLTPREAIKRAELMDTIRDMHDIPARRFELDGLLSDQGVSKMTQHSIERAVRQSLETFVSRTALNDGLSTKFGQHGGFLSQLALSSSIQVAGLAPHLALAKIFNPDQKPGPHAQKPGVTAEAPLASHLSLPMLPGSTFR